MKIGAEVLRRSCIVGKARQHCREYQRQHEREPRRAGSLNINFILTWIKQNVRVALVDALGALHPQGLRGERVGQRQTIATCNRMEAALPANDGYYAYTRPLCPQIPL